MRNIVLRRGADTLQRYIEPAILDLGKDQNAASMQEELFGPILPVLSYHKLEDAVRFVNKRAKPLALYLFTKKRSAEKFVLERVSSGGVCVNDTISHLINPDLPFGGSEHPEWDNITESIVLIHLLMKKVYFINRLTGIFRSVILHLQKEDESGENSFSNRRENVLTLTRRQLVY